MRFGTLVVGSTLSALFAAPALAGGIGFTISFGNGWWAPAQTCAPVQTCVPVQTVCAPVQTVCAPVQTACAPVRACAPVVQGCAPAQVVCGQVAPACGAVVAPVVVQPVYGGGWRGAQGFRGHRHDHWRDFGHGDRNGWHRR